MICSFTQGQESLDSVLVWLERGETKLAKTSLEKYELSQLQKSSLGQYLLAEGIILYREDELIEAYERLQEAKGLKEHLSTAQLYLINDYMMRIANGASEFSTSAESLVQENCSIAKLLDDPSMKIKCIYESSYKDIVGENYELALQLNYQMQKIALDNELEEELLDIENNIGTLHYFQGRYDSTLYYFERNLERCRILKDTLSIAERLNNMAMLRAALGQHDLAINNITEAENLSRVVSDKQFISLLKRNKADILAQAGNYQEASNYYYDHLAMNDTLMAEEISKNIAELQTKYDTAEQERLNAELRAVNSKNESRIYLLISVLALAGVLVVFFVQNHIKTKNVMAAQQVAQQEKEKKLLLDQELASIDAVIAGQEQERLQIASDLHDDLGNSLTTIRLHLEAALDKNPSREVQPLSHALQMLHQVYTKVRRLSHTQHSRVLSEEGWLDSIKELAHQINQSQQLEVEVLHHGLEGRLAHSTELTLFRVIQELLNNIIKHSKATNASISITGGPQSLDIMVEDNGQGFNYSTDFKNGMGLSSIKKKVESLNGRFFVDSSPGNGTTINLEIPTI